jgi:hypothetical protein
MLLCWKQKSAQTSHSSRLDPWQFDFVVVFFIINKSV